jgi:hypothetical protein
MKFKALRKKDTKEFIEISKLGDDHYMVFTSELPKPMGIRATMETIKLYYKYQTKNSNINFDDYELVEFEIFEADTVGADIRNKLTPMKTLPDLLKLLKKRMSKEKRKYLKELVEKEIIMCEKNVDYLANLL